MSLSGGCHLPSIGPPTLCLDSVNKKNTKQWAQVPSIERHFGLSNYTALQTFKYDEHQYNHHLSTEKSVLL